MAWTCSPCATRPISRARTGKGPSFLVCTTYRYGGHHAGDKQEYKDTAEVEAWRQKDPIERFGRQLRDEKFITSKMIAELKQAVETEVRGAVDFARAAAMPEPQDLELYLHA
jgi:Pyruvate/2-oxoglutarate dehydrogenase complex, dehydrogenase (E1) component, eukaryotic type, alpha subunit